MYPYAYFKISVFSHFFKLTHVTPRGRDVINSFLVDYAQMGYVREGRRLIRKVIKVFGARIRDGSEYRFHINQLGPFKTHLENSLIKPDLYPVEIIPVEPGAPANVNVLPTWVLRDAQQKVVEYLQSPLPSKRKLVELQPGAGKTLIATYFACSLKTRIAVVIKPGFIEKWVSDFNKICGLDKKSIYVVQGGSSLMQLITMAKEGDINYDVIIFSNKTLQNWFTLFEKKGQYTLTQGYDCYPEELFPLLKIGVRIIDEVHMDFHFNFKLDLYCHCEVSVSLSATLINDDPFISRMYQVGYPNDHRYAGMEYICYIDAFAFLYHANGRERIRTTEWGSPTYSHHAFESSIMKHQALLQGYLEMINFALKRYYLDGYKDGNRALVYCASIELSTIVKDYLKGVYKDKDVRRYVQEDPYENLMEPDICVSTLLSAGTGHDIDKLSTVILTTAINSSASNIQGFGRLRNLPDINKRFVYFVCADIPKHMEYHARKKDLLQVRALSYTPYTHPHAIG